MSVADLLDDKVIREFAGALSHPDAVVTDAGLPTASGHDFWARATVTKMAQSCE